MIKKVKNTNIFIDLKSDIWYNTIVINDYENMDWEKASNRDLTLFTGVVSGFWKNPGLWKKLFNQQQECCAICGIHQANLRKTLALDHNHKTGKIRGLLCRNCNCGIGFLKADNGIETLEKAIEYVRESG